MTTVFLLSCLLQYYHYTCFSRKNAVHQHHFLPFSPGQAFCYLSPSFSHSNLLIITYIFDLLLEGKVIIHFHDHKQTFPSVNVQPVLPACRYFLRVRRYFLMMNLNCSKFRITLQATQASNTLHNEFALKSGKKPGMFAYLYFNLEGDLPETFPKSHNLL